MSSNEGEFPVYLQFLSNTLNVVTLLSGFTFTAITILLALLPDPSALLSQITLFLLTLMLDLLTFSLGFFAFYGVFCVRNVPPEIKGRSTIARLVTVGGTVWGLALVLMYLLWSLTLLALAQTMMFALSTILTYIYSWKPFAERSKKLRFKSEN